MQKQFEYKNWEVTFSLCHQISRFGNIALPFNISWFCDNDVIENSCWQISLDILCFTFHIEIWKWKKD